jgi:hypothetical protein
MYNFINHPTQTRVNVSTDDIKIDSELSSMYGELTTLRLEFAILALTLSQINGLDPKIKKTLAEFSERNEIRSKELIEKFNSYKI